MLKAMTPMMKQYHAIKEQHRDVLLMYRMGDFYELFGEDATLAAPVLDVALTRRPQSDGADIPMCGVPAHAYEPYVARLVRDGYKVAICEQTESVEEAKKRAGSGALIKREVVRILTPGTLLEEGLLPSRQSNYLLTISKPHKNKVGLAVLELSVGNFWVESIALDQLPHAIAKWAPTEILCPDVADVVLTLREQLPAQTCLNKLPPPRFDTHNARERLLNFYNVTTLEAFGAFDGVAIQAAGVALDYVYLTQKQYYQHIQPLKTLKQHMFMDAATRRNLELVCSTHGTYEGSLLSVMDDCQTAMGSRCLYRLLQAPETHLDTIQQRLDYVEAFVSAPSALKDVRSALNGCPDMERALTRIQCLRCSPRDLGVMRESLKRLQAIEGLKSQNNIAALNNLDLSGSPDILALLNNALADQLPVHARDGNFIASGFCEQLDGFRTARDQSADMLKRLQEKYIQQTTINALKIKHNHVWGYFVEIPSSHKDKIPHTFVHRQTLAQAMRFTTEELIHLEQQISGAGEQALAREHDIFQELIHKIKATNLQGSIEALTNLDVWANLAHIASTRGYVRPCIDASYTLHIEGGRHPVVEHMGAQNFTPNDCCFSEHETLCLLTGPNMAGKSTYLRQQAIIALLAHIGSFVPAKHAHIGLVDRIFSRIGASDDLAGGRSTFMVEMLETATILNQATSASLVILDELGRGTSTHDGLALAWAVVEDLHNRVMCRTLFATHYHELQNLQLKAIKRSTLRVHVGEAGDITFFHEVIPGAAEGSYGLYVAKRAGVPAFVLERAHNILDRLEQTATKPKQTKLNLIPIKTADIKLDNTAPVKGASGKETLDQQALEQQEKAKTAVDQAKDALVHDLKKLNISNMTPLEAMQWLDKAQKAYAEKNLAEESLSEPGQSKTGTQ